MSKSEKNIYISEIAFSIVSNVIIHYYIPYRSYILLIDVLKINSRVNRLQQSAQKIYLMQNYATQEMRTKT